MTGATIQARIVGWIDAAICFAQKTWGPLVCTGVAVTMLLISVAIGVNAIYLPLKTGTAMDLSGLAGLVASLSTLVASLFPFIWAKTRKRQPDPPF